MPTLPNLKNYGKTRLYECRFFFLKHFFISYPNSQFAQSMTYIQLPPANKMAKVMFSMMSVCQSVYPQVRVSLFRTMAPSSSVHNPRPGPHLYRTLTPAPGHVQLGLHCPAPPTTCSNLFTMKAWTVVKQIIGIRLKCLHVYFSLISLEVSYWSFYKNLQTT